jgi:hypothetical protein
MDGMLGPNARLFLIFCVVMAVAAVLYLAYYLFVDDSLPDAAALETTLAAMVAEGDTVARATRMLVGDGFECGLVAGQTTGTWHCDLAERVPTGEFDCPRRISVLLVPNEDKSIASFSVTDAEICM